MNYLFARKAGGDFILRIEDTDQERSSKASERDILNSLSWLGIEWDEGPDIGGDYGPYRQSERTGLYRRYADELLSSGNAFKCFCSKEVLDEMRTDQRRRNVRMRYDGRCAELSTAAVEQLERSDNPFVIRMKVPPSGVCVVEDLGRGHVEIGWDSVDMQVLVKSDGFPTYHLANVVDDHLMGITHVFRGEEWLPSAPKHILLYRYFGWEMPVLFHLPLLRNADRSKLSKRKNPTSITLYRRMGYLPEALLNFLGLFGIGISEGEELMSKSEMIERFDIRNVSLGGPVFDVKKLDWLNGRYIREQLDSETFAKRFVDWCTDGGRLEASIPLLKDRIERFTDVAPQAAFLLAGRLNLSLEELIDEKVAITPHRKGLALALQQIETLPYWGALPISEMFRHLADFVGIKTRVYLRIFYRAITGKPASIPLFDAMEVLGKDICRERLRQALETLGSPTKAEGEEWQSEFASKASVADTGSDIRESVSS
jgi:glutamyl-tRNA synthetase